MWCAAIIGNKAWLASLFCVCIPGAAICSWSNLQSIQAFSIQILLHRPGGPSSEWLSRHRPAWFPGKCFGTNCAFLVMQKHYWFEEARIQNILGWSSNRVFYCHWLSTQPFGLRQPILSTRRRMDSKRRSSRRKKKWI